MSETTADTLGSRLRSARHGKGWTLGDLRRECGFTIPHLSDIERDRTVASTKALSAICAALDVRISWALNESAGLVDIETTPLFAEVMTELASRAKYPLTKRLVFSCAIRALAHNLEIDAPAWWAREDLL